MLDPRDGEEPESIAARIDFEEWLLLPKVGQGGRRPFPFDPVTHALVAGTFRYPAEGDTVPIEAGKQAVWAAVHAPDEGPLQDSRLLGGWVYASIHSPGKRRAILRAKGHVVCYINGAPRVMNVYRYSYVMIPVLLEEGENHFLFRCTRFGTLEAWLEPVTHDVMINMEDATLPEAVSGESGTLDAGIVFLNTTTRFIDLGAIQGTVGGSEGEVRFPSFTMPPLSIAKLPVMLPARQPKSGKIVYSLGGSRVQPVRVEVPVVAPGAFRKVTFRSEVDGSVQYYGYRPARAPNAGGPFALMLHLHGASDEAATYRNLYCAKTWCVMASATNRRPYGFNWESLGRIDALEVLDHALSRSCIDPSRIYLGGHSMGGHGVWQVAGHVPDRFAAIGPGAGWQDIWTYANVPRLPAAPTEIQRLLDRCANPSRTALLKNNYRQHGVLIIHGDADSVVSIKEAYGMKELLESTDHHDLTMVVEPGGGHVYDTTPEKGYSCFDLLELFEFFQRHARPLVPQRVDFTTVMPSISDSCHWVRVEQQVRQIEPSRARLQIDPGRRWLHGTLDNVKRFSVDPSILMEPGSITLELDGEAATSVDWSGGELFLARTAGGWQPVPALDPCEKGPHRGGPFKNVFYANRPVLVVGTKGKPDENAWAMAKAQFDNESLWYRGNGSYEIVLDRDFDPAQDQDRNVVLYGNSETNTAWDPLMKSSPVQLQGGRITVGERQFDGGNLACLVIRPRPGSDIACVGVVGGAGLVGMRATNELGFFSAGIYYPDFTVFSADVWEKSDQAVLAAGLFGNDWNLDEESTVFAP